MRFYDNDRYKKYLNEYNVNLQKMKVSHGEKCDYNSLRNIDLFEKWCEKENIKGCFNIADIKLLINSIKPNKIQFETIPFQDHAELFKRKNEERVFIMQPYKNKVEINKLQEWAKNRGLRTKIYDNLSWHLTNETILIQFEIDNIEKFNKITIMN